MTLNEWAEVCLDVYKPNQKKGTKYYYTYRNRLKNCVLNPLGEKDIGSIAPIDCQMCINLQKGNSSYQISQTKQMLNFLFERAMDNNIIEKNPARNIIRPNGTKESRRSLTDRERAAFLRAIEDPVNLPFAFMYYCGLRPSEARDIKESDLISINGRTALHIRGTKSKNAVRDIPVTDDLSRLIQNSLKTQNRASQGYLCLLTPSGMRFRWERLKSSDAELSAPDLVPYCLRHTYCSDLMKKGIDIRIAQKLMGHSTINLTSTIYSHLDEDLFTITADTLSGK